MVAKVIKKCENVLLRHASHIRNVHKSFIGSASAPSTLSSSSSSSSKDVVMKLADFIRCLRENHIILTPNEQNKISQDSTQKKRKNGFLSCDEVNQIIVQMNLDRNLLIWKQKMIQQQQENLQEGGELDNSPINLEQDNPISSKHPNQVCSHVYKILWRDFGELFVRCLFLDYQYHLFSHHHDDSSFNNFRQKKQSIDSNQQQQQNDKKNVELNDFENFPFYLESFIKNNLIEKTTTTNEIDELETKEEEKEEEQIVSFLQDFYSPSVQEYLKSNHKLIFQNWPSNPTFDKFSNQLTTSPIFSFSTNQQIENVFLSPFVQQESENEEKKKENSDEKVEEEDQESQQEDEKSTSDLSLNHHLKGVSLNGEDMIYFLSFLAQNHLIPPPEALTKEEKEEYEQSEGNQDEEEESNEVNETEKEIHPIILGFERLLHGDSKEEEEQNEEDVKEE